MARVVGLDIGSFAVRAAELNVGNDVPTLLRFGQVALPPHAVRGGEIADSDAVGAAIRRLWREGGFKAKAVTIGVANQRVIGRLAELPSMSESDLATALQFEAQELIPIPIDEALLDFQILEQIPDPEAPRMRILLAAAQRDMVGLHLSSLEHAGINASLVDFTPFALVRALASSSQILDSGVEAIVCIGAGVTNVVIHEQGIPRFMRILLTGGDDVTQAIAAGLGVEPDVAEDLKRRAAYAGDAQTAQAGQIIATRLAGMVDEIRGSLEYYVSQPDALPLQRVLVTGGGSRTAGLVERLQQQLFAPVDLAHPLAAIRVGDIGLSEQQLAEAEQLLTVPIGLALAGSPLPRGSRRINLIPREIAAKAEQRQQAILAGSAVGGLAILLLALWFLKGSQVDRENQRAADAEAEAAQLQSQVNALQDIVRLDSELASRTAAIELILANDVAYTKVVQEIATVMPGDVWLTSLSVTAVAGAQGTVGNIATSVQGFDHTSTARWILRLSTLPSVSGLWVPSSTRAGGAVPGVTFSSSWQLTSQALASRIDRYRGTVR